MGREVLVTAVKAAQEMVELARRVGEAAAQRGDAQAVSRAADVLHAVARASFQGSDLLRAQKASDAAPEELTACAADVVMALERAAAELRSVLAPAPPPE